MRAAQVERWSVRAALALGFCVTLGLWLYTGYAFTSRIDSVRVEASAAAARYTRAQELLSTVRSQLLVSSIRVRDALLDPDRTALPRHRQEIQVAARAIDEALTAYEPVLRVEDENARILNLRNEVDRFHTTSMAVLDDAATRKVQDVRQLLNAHIVPRREAALAISEEIARLNRAAFIQQQSELSQIHAAAELASRRQLGTALVIGLGVLLVTSMYAGRLESHLRTQLVRDARLSSEVQQTAAKVLNAQEEERRTIARELHDEVGQVLTAVRVELEMAQHAIEQGAPASTLTEAKTLTEGALHTVRNLTQLLHPAALDDLGLPAVIEASMRGLSRRTNIQADFDHANWPQQVPRDVELAAYRIVQEGLTNVAKHARATSCRVSLKGLADRLLLEIEDNGIGFVDDTDRPIVARGLGLLSIRERATRLGGSFEILSEPGNGTRLIVSFPQPASYA